MDKDNRRRDNLRESLTAKGRSRREAVARLAEAEKGTGPRRNDMLPSLQIVPYPVAALKSHVRKLRKADAAHVREIANSVSVLGFSVPLLVGKDNVVVDGDFRLETAKLLGLPAVPCIRVDHLDEMEQRLLRLAVNRLGEKGCWDVGELQAEFTELIIADAPIEISGFGPDEIDQIVIGGDEDDVGDRSFTGASATAQAGDLFLLGPHRLICGDATDPAIMERLMRTDIARMVFTDEPFNVAIAGNVSGIGHRDFVMAAGEMTDTQFLDFNREVDERRPSTPVRRRNPWHVYRWRGLPIAHAAATDLGLSPINLVVWAKTNAGKGSLYRSQHELLPLFKKGTASHVNNISFGKRGRYRTTFGPIRCLLAWIGRPERPTGSSDCETNRNASRCADRPDKPG